MKSPYQRRGSVELLAGNLYLDAGGDHRDAVFLAGSGRSGTTWLSTMIGAANHSRFIFEPFDPRRVPICGGFLRKQYLRPDDSRPEFLHAAERILSGSLRDRWTDRHNRKILARRRVIKDIRANLLLGWLHSHFPEMPVVLLLRHPCAVADSRLRLGWRDNLDEVMSQKDLIEDHLRPFEAGILSARNPFERSVFMWCIENFVPLKQLGQNGALIVFHESLLKDPERELERLSGFLGEVFDPARMMHGMPDSPTRERLIYGWTERIDGAHTERAAGILRLFGLDRLYGEGPLPRPDGLRGLASFRRP